MPKDGRIFVKPGGLAQTKNEYDMIKQETIERNNKRMENLGIKPLPTSMPSSSQTTTEGKRKVDWDNDSDKEYHPPENEEGLFSSGDDDEFYGLEAKKRTVSLKNKKRTVKMKQPRWPVGAMDATSQPSLITSQLPLSPITDQTQPRPATTQPYPPPTKTKKLPRWPAGAMDATSRPSLTTSQLPPSPITDQTQPRPATTQPYPPPTKTKKLPRWPVGAMTATSQPLPTTSQLPPSPITDQAQPRPATDQPQAPPTVTKKLPRFPAGSMTATSRSSPNNSQPHPPQLINQLQPQPTANQPQPLLTTNLPEPQPTMSRKRRSRRLDGSRAAARGRGPSRPYKYWGTGKKLEVVLDTDNQPIGDTGAILQSQLGILARNGNFAPLTYTDWRAPQLTPYKERIWNEVKDNTNVPEVFKHNCLMSVSKKWRDWKDYLKIHYYDTYETDEERLNNCPERVNPDQWSILVKFWGGQCAKERSDTNLANREFQTMGHTSGRKAHCRVRAELAKEKGVEPNEVDRIAVFEKTHTKSDGNPVDKASEAAIVRLKEGMSQVPESLQSPTFKEEVFREVLGQDKHGRVRTYGLGACPSQVFGTRFTRSQELRDREQLREELRKEVVDEVRKEVIDEVRKEVLAEFGDRFSSLERMCARFEAHAKDIGYPLAPSPEADSLIEPTSNKQKGCQQPCNVKNVSDANGTPQQNSNNRFGFFEAWTDNELDDQI
ncbi:hypothetical protein Vadar_033102 [Vaccinium darrowii]|nr:hypothetical protein Vadar_033102 [Vaccinium darrowii]